MYLKNKRKKPVADDSEDENSVNVDKEAYETGISAYKPSPEPEGVDESPRCMLVLYWSTSTNVRHLILARMKRPRTSSPDIEDLDNGRNTSVFSKKLASFKKPFPSGRFGISAIVIPTALASLHR